MAAEGFDSFDDQPVQAPAPEVAAEAPAVQAAAAVAAPVVSRAERAETVASPTVALRRGLPRTPGGEPWPPADAGARAVVDPVAVQPISAASSVNDPEAAPAAEPLVAERVERVEVAVPSGIALRRGLPRTPGGEPWPPADAVATVAVVPVAATEPASASSEAVVAASEAPSTPGTDISVPLPFQRTVWQGDAPRHGAPAPEPVRHGPFTKGQWAGVVVIGGIALLGAAAMAVFFVRWLLSTTPLQDFLTTYPGEYHLPEGAPVGFPGWLGWQHFFNVFLMVLIIRSGLRIRTEKRPTAFWTPRGKSSGKVSLTIWFHQSLDILWLVNGVVFIVLLFATGQWMRVIPTSWEVFPNALSAILQYISLDWPTENGWANYNSVQQIAYFTTIFIAAPLAAVTGFRMSGMWPKKAEKLSKAYPIEWARAVHFPVMLYFVVFIAIHVFLVFATGALRNLNHMFAAQGSVDPTAYADNWTGFWFFVASLVVIAAAWVAARPMVLAPIAKLFGTVSSR
ncbi:cytochrome b/b6 domain-containing protein [Microbacterium sp. GXF6406]